jgi:hypothetical protein
MPRTRWQRAAGATGPCQLFGCVQVRRRAWSQPNMMRVKYLLLRSVVRFLPVISLAVAHPVLAESEAEPERAAVPQPAEAERYLGFPRRSVVDWQKFACARALRSEVHVARVALLSAWRGSCGWVLSVADTRKRRSYRLSHHHHLPSPKWRYDRSHRSRWSAPSRAARRKPSGFVSSLTRSPTEIRSGWDGAKR